MTATELADELRPMCDLAHAIAPCDRCGWPVITGKTGKGYPSGHGSWDGVTQQSPKHRWTAQVRP